MAVFEAIQRHRNAIVERWAAEAQKAASARGLSGLELRNLMPAHLAALAGERIRLNGFESIWRVISALESGTGSTSRKSSMSLPFSSAASPQYRKRFPRMSGPPGKTGIGSSPPFSARSSR